VGSNWRITSDGSKHWKLGRGRLNDEPADPDRCSKDASHRPTLIRITGSLPDAAPVRATVDYHELEREPDETLRTFEARVLVAARAVGGK
jgi:hypothetical protein